PPGAPPAPLLRPYAASAALLLEQVPGFTEGHRSPTLHDRVAPVGGEGEGTDRDLHRHRQGSAGIEPFHDTGDSEHDDEPERDGDEGAPLRCERLPTRNRARGEPHPRDLQAPPPAHDERSK